MVMKFFDKLRVKKSLDVLLGTAAVPGPEQEQALARLTQLGRAAIPHVLPALGTVPTPTVLVDFLTRRVDNASLADFVAGLTDRNPRVVTQVVTILARSKSYDPHPLLELLAAPTAPRAALLQILTARPEALRPAALLGLLQLPDKETRAAALRLVEQVATEAWLPELLPYLRSEDWLIRQHLAQILGRLRTAASVEALAQLLTDPQKSVRLAALSGLANAQLPLDVEPLCALLRDPDLTVQSQAIEALIKINHPHTLRHLLPILQDDSEYVRRAAVEVLNAVGTTEAIKDLLSALGDADWWVRARAADALGNIGGPIVVESVLPLLHDPDALIRRCAVEILNTTRDTRAVDALIGVLDDADWWVQERAVDALAALGEHRAVPALLDLLSQHTAAVPTVLRALGTLGDAQAVPAIVQTLSQGTPAIQKEALRALALLTDASYAALAQQAILQVTQSADSETKALAESVLQTLLRKYGERRQHVTPHTSIATTTLLSQHSLLGDSGPMIQGSATTESLFHGTTEINSDTAVDRAPELPSQAQAQSLEPGTVLDGRYRVVRRVGRGGFGTAVLVHDLVVNEEIILKFLHASIAADPRIIKGFIRELRYARKITHENVIRIYDFLSISGSYAISMEYFPSHTLSSEAMPLTIPRALHILDALCKGVSVAHQANIVHRDLKPHNILLNDQDLVKIVDFGLAAGISPTDSRLTQRSARMGTPAYMAPEQARGGVIDLRTDLYSIGIIMYELFTGKPPYTGHDPIEIVFQHVEGKPRAPREMVPSLPPALEGIILKAMAVRPDDRFQSIDTLREALAALPRCGVDHGTP